MAMTVDAFLQNMLNTIYNFGAFMLTLFGFQIVTQTVNGQTKVISIRAPSLQDFLVRVIEIAALVIIIVFAAKKLLASI